MSITAWQASSWSAATMTPLPAASPLAFTTRAGKSALLTDFNRWASLNRCRIERFYCTTMFVKLNGGCLSTAAALWLLSPSKCSTLSVSVARMRHNHHILTSLTPSSIPGSKLLTISFSIMAPLLCLMAPKPNKHFYWKTWMIQELTSWNVGLSALIVVSVCTNLRMKLQASWGSVKEP